MVDDSGITSDARIGELVDERYRVLEGMASGSMGVVYKAERVPVGKLVAIKFLHAPFANDSEFLARFERETRVMSKLTHPNCVSVVDFGVWDGAPYLVMEYVSGTTLRALIDNGPLPPRRALALVRQIAAGLAHAHAQGVVHRDVKPANIMISEEIGTGDHVRILDFGLARLRGAVGRDATQSNIVVGTPNYMAPEQTVGGGLIDARTDIYAVGVVLFEMVCGDRPFQAEDTLALLGMHRAAPIPRLADRMPGDAALPRGLQELIESAMAKSPADRFQSAIELAEAVDEVASARPVSDHDDFALAIEAKKSMGTAPTILDVSEAAELIGPPTRRGRPRGSFLGSLVFLAILAGGIGATVWWVKMRNAGGKKAASAATGSGASGATSDRAGRDTPDARPAAAIVASPGSAATPAAGGAGSTTGGPAGVAIGGGAGSAGSTTGGPAGVAIGGGAGSAGSTTGGPADASRQVGAAGTGNPDRTGGTAGTSAAAGSAAAAPVPVEAVADAGTAELTGAAEHPSDPAAVPGADIEMDPATADDPAPASAKPSGDADEAANAPKTAEEVERHAPPPPPAARGTTLEGAVQLIKEGKRDLALASLRALWKKTPASGYIPFLLGNLYYDQRWWTVAMEHYSAAIKKNARYRANPTINRNVIRMLASSKTRRKAQGFLKYTVGRPALPYVRHAAQHDSNSQVRGASAWLVRNI
jgi:TolA-binding protein